MTSKRTQALIEAMDSDTLAHYGVKGMKWGIRKDRDGKNIDGVALQVNLDSNSTGVLLKKGNLSQRQIDATIRDLKKSSSHVQAKMVAKQRSYDRIKSINDSYKAKGIDLSAKKDLDAYHKDIGKSLTDLSKQYTPEGLLSEVYIRPDGTMILAVGTPDSMKDLKHSAEQLESFKAPFKLTRDADGYITDIQASNAEPTVDKVKHSALTDLLNTEVDSDELAHYGVKGMKWGKKKVDIGGVDELEPEEPPKRKTLEEILAADRKHKEYRKKHPAEGAFNDNVKISTKIKPTKQPNRREIQLTPLDGDATTKKKKKKGTPNTSAKPFLKHSYLTDLLNTEVDSDVLAHYGVKGMKWGKRKKTNVDGGSGGALDETLIDQDVTIDGKTYTPEEFLALRKKTASDIKKKHANSPIGKLNKILTDMGLPPLVTSAPQKSKDMRDVIKEENSKKKKATVKRSNVEGLATPNSKPGTFEVYASPKKKKLTHSALSELLNTDVDSDELAHYGVMGMKWGVRKDRSTGKRGSRKAAKLEKRKGTVNQVSEKKSRGSNKLSENPQNRKISDAELTKLVNRIRLEKTYADLTRVPPPPPAVTSRFKKALVDTAFNVGTSAATDVGKAILTQALKVQYNKRASAPYHIQLKEVKKAVDNATGS